MSRRMQQAFAVLAVSGAGFVGWSAQAAVPEGWKDCEKEVAQYCPKAQSDDAIFHCIEKREGLGKKAGLSKACSAAHERYEAQTGKEGDEAHEQHEHHEEQK